jgi:hypothetical protein
VRGPKTEKGWFEERSFGIPALSGGGTPKQGKGNECTSTGQWEHGVIDDIQDTKI